MIDFLRENFSQLIVKIGEHLFISSLAIVLGIIVAVPAGIAVTRSKKLSVVLITIASILQTIPSLALLSMMVPIIGIGKLPAIIALFIYSLLPIIRNTMLGINGVNEFLVDAGKGMGMTANEIMFKIKLPLSAPVIMSGIRLSAVYVVSWTAIASYIGAGGLGDFIFSGLNTFDTKLIFLGTICVTIIAICTDFLLGKLEKFVEPKTSSR
ncbi:putative choline transport system permease protein opuBB [Peptostreptococcaceae bacterium AS15]|nr:putative choline transport system permease protein opuBB [Peptostreptococcaceae bacterium AS15]